MIIEDMNMKEIAEVLLKQLEKYTEWWIYKEYNNIWWYDKRDMLLLVALKNYLE